MWELKSQQKSSILVIRNLDHSWTIRRVLNHRIMTLVQSNSCVQGGAIFWPRRGRQGGWLNTQDKSKYLRHLVSKIATCLKLEDDDSKGHLNTYNNGKRMSHSCSPASQDILSKKEREGWSNKANNKCGNKRI